MKDIDRLKQLLNDFGVGFEERTDAYGAPYIECREGMERVEGYHKFLVNFDFDEDGKFSRIGIWE